MRRCAGFAVAVVAAVVAGRCKSESSNEDPDRVTAPLAKRRLEWATRG